MKAIDVYAGVGGWSAGLRCAGIEVAEAYELWPAALETYNANLGTDHQPQDVRLMDLTALPNSVQLVVGSPPCTHFSFANRGGGGDIEEGLRDVVRFLEIVETVRPRYWLMENVPRTASLIREGLVTPDHALFRFRSLNPTIGVVDFADFGLPQSRSRCLVGVFPFELLDSYKDKLPERTLGEVLSALSAHSSVVDPVWGHAIARGSLTEMEPEPVLSGEQLRMNREAKRFHPVYNDMAFPDELDRPSRTVTATCTRVSRESIVIADPAVGSIRRLTVRERASLQGFPVTYQFFGVSHSQKVKMVGNAVPPYFAYLVGLAARETAVSDIKIQPDLPHLLPAPAKVVPVTPPHAIGTSYPSRRRFRAVLPGLRFKSGMRFQLTNDFREGEVRWIVEFLYGPSKDVQQVDLDDDLFTRFRQQLNLSAVLRRVASQLGHVRLLTQSQTPMDLQGAWTQCSTDRGPYQVVDALGRAGLALQSEVSILPLQRIREEVLAVCATGGAVLSRSKLVHNAPAVLAGLLLGSWFNALAWGAPHYATEGAKEVFIA